MVGLYFRESNGLLFRPLLSLIIQPLYYNVEWNQRENKVIKQVEGHDTIL